MRKITTAAAILVMGLFMAGLFVAPVNAAVATAPNGWNVGDSWAMGKEMDFGSDITDNTTVFNNALKSMTNLTLDKLNVESKAGFYVLFKVTGTTATSYILDAKVAVKFATQANVAVSGKLPVAGTYDTDDNAFSPLSTVAKETKTVSLALTEKLGIVLGATLDVDKTTMAVNQVDWTLRSAMVLEFDGKNIPQVDTNGTVQTIGYKDYDIGMELVARANLSTLFTPALDIYQFPFATGETWYTNNSMVTVNGDVSGFLNAHGLTAEQEEKIFTDELKNTTGSTSFPIEFDHLSSPEGEITDGQFGPYYGNVTSMKMECLSSITQTLNGVQQEVFVIEVDDGAQMLYSPGYKFIAGMSADVDADSLPVDLPEEVSIVTSFMGNQNMEMEPISVEAATTSIASIETYTDSVATQAGAKGTTSGSLEDFFLKAPYLGIIMVVVAAAIVAALVFVGTRPRKP